MRCLQNLIQKITGDKSFSTHCIVPLADLDIEYLTIQYDCISVPYKEELDSAFSAYKDGCHSDLPASGPTRALILETFEVKIQCHK